MDDGLSLAKALRCRAQAHYELHRYQACLADLHLSLDKGYPQPLRYQIYRAMGETYYYLREEKRAKISCQLALKLLDEQITRLETTQVKGYDISIIYYLNLGTILQNYNLYLFL